MGGRPHQPWQTRTQREIRILYGDEYVSGTNRLPVDAQLTVQDIQIGAVEIKDADSDDRVDVIDAQTFPSGSEFALSISGQVKIFDSLGNNIDTDNPLPVQVLEGLSDTVFSATILSVSGGSALINNPIFMLRNPAGSGKTINVLEVHTGIDEQNRSARFVVYDGPTVSATGSVLTVTNRDLPSATVTVMEAYQEPTVSANGIAFHTIQTGQNVPDKMTEFNQSLVLGEGDDVLFTTKPSDNNALMSITVVWVEV